MKARYSNVLAAWALIMYVLAICFALRLVWESLAGPHGGQLTTAVGAVTCALAGTIYLALSLRSDR